MKILYVNGADIEGGAAKAATRLLQAVRPLGSDPGLYVQRLSGDFPLVSGPATRLGKAFGYARPKIEQLLHSIDPATTTGPFCSAFLPDKLASQVSGAGPQIVHLHWVARMMRLETLRHIKVPIVWTMHDSWAFTGGCYLPGGCTRYTESCGRCSVLGSEKEKDLSRRVWKRKHEAWRGLDLTLVAPSRWMAQCARRSSLFRTTRIEVIPNGIDVECYRPIDKKSAREVLGLPQDKKFILFGAKAALLDANKGFHLLREALQQLSEPELKEQCEVLVFGLSEPEQPPELGFRTRYLGRFNDDVSLAMVYAAADVFVMPSLQENLPYTVMESLSCGTPCVAFDQGGVSDLVQHQVTGYLARPYQTQDLAQGIRWVLGDPQRRQELSAAARSKVVTEFELGKIAKRHVELYEELLRR